MKKLIITFNFLLNIFVSEGQSTMSVNNNTSKTVLPSKYAIVLYSDQISDTSGANKLLAAHWVNKGGGSFTWNKDIKEKGEYEVAICYGVNKSGTVANISVESNRVLSSTLDVTSGFYSEFGDWSKVNFERRRIPGTLNLNKGKNLITLELLAKNDSDVVNLYAIELLPVSKKEAVEKEMVSSKKKRPILEWFSNTPYGVMFHWTSQSTPEYGAKKAYNDAVNSFDVDAFVNMVVKTGAGYVIFTTNHAEPYFPAPLKEWENIYPGHTTQRDLVEAISDGLKKHNIKLFLYLATHVYAKNKSVNDSVFQKLNFSLVGEIGKRYKNKVAGFWFDGWYQCYSKHPNFDFEQFYKICKIGNPERLICLNTWLYPINTLWQDYWAGEVYTLGRPPAYQFMKDGPGNGLQSQDLIVMETEDWLHTRLNTKIPSPHLKGNELISFISKSKGKGPVTINMQIYQDGRVGDEALKLMEEVKKGLINQ